MIQLGEIEKRKEPQFADYLRESLVPSWYSDHEAEDDFGANKAGAWDSKGFVLRSGIVLTLGAQEDFEKSIIRILLNNQSSIPFKPQNLFKPTLGDYLKETGVWKRREQETWKCEGRRNLLKELGLAKPDNQSWYKRLNTARNDRNHIAHGYCSIDVTLTRFLEIHYDVFAAMNYWASECLSKHHIDV